MTDLEIVQSAIGEKITYGHNADYVITEIYRNHVVLIREGHEEDVEMGKMKNVAMQVIETRNILEARIEP